MNLVQKARVFATAAHAAVAQTRKYTKEPYIVHPIEVMNIVKTVPHSREMLCAALLHDVVEDTQMDIWTIDREFGYGIAKLVSELTDDEYPEDWNRDKKKKAEVFRWATKCSNQAQTVKCADIISNTTDIAKNDKDFAVVYVREMERLLKVLTGADRSLHERALQQVLSIKEELKS